MRVAGILAIPDIIEILRDSLSTVELDGMEYRISCKMRIPGVVFMLSDDKSIVIILESLGSNDKAQVHIYSKDTKGQRTTEFVTEVADWIVENTTYQCFIGFTPKDNHTARVLARIMGFKKIGEVQLDSGATEQITMITRDQWIARMKYKEEN